MFRITEFDVKSDCILCSLHVLARATHVPARAMHVPRTCYRGSYDSSRFSAKLMNLCTSVTNGEGVELMQPVLQIYNARLSLFM